MSNRTAWDEESEERLEQRVVVDGVRDHCTLAVEFGRTPGGIRNKLYAMGLVQNRHENQNDAKRMIKDGIEAVAICCVDYRRGCRVTT